MPRKSSGAHGQVKKVSVITPTFGRAQYLPHLLRCFKHQTYPDKELLILDDSPEPDGNLKRLRDPDVRYMHLPERLPVGAKRNLLMAQARGDIIVQFDDDDYYAPEYIQQMVSYLGDHDFFTLSAWYAYSLRDNFFAYWDTRVIMPYHHKLHPREGVQIVSGDHLSGYLDSCLWGFGFSYVFKKSVYPTVSFGALNFGEDYDFVQKLTEAGFRRHSLPDEIGLVLHLIHVGNMSCIYPQYRLPSFVLPIIFGEELLEYAVLENVSKGRRPQRARPARKRKKAKL